MTVELICVGTELLLGNIVNTNAAFISEKCAMLGLSMYYQSVVGDNPGRLEHLLRMAKERSDVIILSGGLGPTQDDLTKETAAEVMGKTLVEDARAKNEIQEFLSKRGHDITENNWKQALVPEGCKVLYNANGTAPGIIMEDGDSRMILLPGPPNELIPMFEEQVYPYLHSLQPEIICSKMVKLCGIGESAAETKILDLINEQKNPTVAPYAKTGEVHLRITAKAENEKKAFAMIEPVEEILKQRFGDCVFTDDPQVTLEMAVAELLKKHRLTVTTAESCTGGLLAGRLINVSGISKQLQEGYITYSNEAKEKLLGVSHATLETYGAVSPQTAAEMAEGGAKAAGADVCIAVTGIAGPEGGTKEKPVGLVYMGCCLRGKVYTEKNFYSGSRSKIREYSVASALTLLRKVILKELEE
ncbi:competence/damage-inducible protein A [Petralouisia muris]|jgi:nicotinamide-nucleotide amidase|uniref:Competence/damage-inducible protein A n=1 Tax=Petralouisia muris TaxID=3032872 RepID=A0AC61RYT2_9FIRM|nr:competence/damage-inducible protein A [Petralouisia muris]TGY96945.1 competence/damage-inducible protein A [Petralouisia muris]